MDRSTAGFERKLYLVARLWLFFVSEGAVPLHEARMAHAMLKAWLLATEGALFPVQGNEQQ